MAPGGPVDTDLHGRMPAREDWPRIDVDPRHADGMPLNCAVELLHRHLGQGHDQRIALIGADQRLSYAQLRERADRIAHVLTRDHGVVPGQRVLLRGANGPMLAAAWLATQLCGAVAVTTMPLLRRRELADILDIARPNVALCEAEGAAELVDAVAAGSNSLPVLGYREDGVGDALESAMARHPAPFTPCATSAEDISLIGFTSGTTGRPKATVHFHRDVMAICRVVADHVVQPVPGDVFIGTAPLAFTFGLGGLLLFPLHGGAASVLMPHGSAAAFADAVRRHRATVCFTVPTFYQRLAPLAVEKPFPSLRLCVSSGEALPSAVRRRWQQATGLALAELLGATEMLHAFVGARGDDIREGFIGRALPGYEIAILDPAGRVVAPGEPGRLAVRGPTGCRYLDDPRQRDYVQNGWNLTGDTCAVDADGYLRYHARADDMIVSSGYNISGIEVEAVLMEHPAVAECAVVGSPDPERGQVVTAWVVPREESSAAAPLAEALRAHVRQHLAPYKYPRRIHFLAALPRNESGKLQRFRLAEESGDGV